ncbi:MAG TPA: hypothetical protein VMT20_05365 [Terriglobia bacterium]|nr:hypothetical protein [Terriglobia bacterium]
MTRRTTITGKLAKVLAGTLWCASVSAASPAGSGRQPTLPPSETVPFPVRVMDYGNLTAPLTIVFRYTALASGAAGQAEILPGPTKWKINAAFTNLSPASRLGSEYLTYVLWCITPEGRSINLGEVTLTGTDGQLDAKLNLRRFGLIITAEPYLSVSRPNKAVAFEADVAPDSSPRPSVTQVNCELLSIPIGAGTAQADPVRTKDPDEPLVIEEARRAIAVARAAGAEEYAPDTFGTAQQLLRLAQDQQERGEKKKDVVDTGGEAVFIAEDARVLAVTRQKRAREARTAASHDTSP